MPPSGPRAIPTALRGALLLTAVGGAGVLMLAAIGAAKQSSQHLEAALALLTALFGSGAAGGGIYHLIRPLPGGSRLRAATAPLLASAAALTALAVLVRAMLPGIELTGLDADRAALLTGTRAVVTLGLAGIVVAWIIAEAATAAEHPAIAAGIEHRGAGKTLLPWATACLLIWAVISLLGLPMGLRMPEGAEDAGRALALAQAELRDSPDDAHAQLVAGVSLLHLEQYKEAEPVLERAARLAPRNSHPRNALGYTLMRQERFDEAITHFWEALSIDPDYAVASRNLGWCLAASGRLNEAEAAYRNAVRLSPKEAGAAGEYGRVLQLQAKPEQALTQFLRAVALTPEDAWLRGTTASLLMDLGRLDEAKVQLEHALRLAPEAAENWAKLGETNYMLGDYGAAATGFAEAARLDPRYLSEDSAAYAMWRAALRETGGSTGTPLVAPSPVQRGVRQ